MYKKMNLEELLSSLDGWNAVAGREAIHKKFTFKDFESAFAAMSKIAIAICPRVSRNDLVARHSIKIESTASSGLTPTPE